MEFSVSFGWTWYFWIMFQLIFCHLWWLMKIIFTAWGIRLGSKPFDFLRAFLERVSLKTSKSYTPWSLLILILIFFWFSSLLFNVIPCLCFHFISLVLRWQITDYYEVSWYCEKSNKTNALLRKYWNVLVMSFKVRLIDIIYFLFFLILISPPISITSYTYEFNLIFTHTYDIECVGSGLDYNEIANLCDSAEHIFSSEPRVLQLKAKYLVIYMGNLEISCTFLMSMVHHQLLVT